MPYPTGFPVYILLSKLWLMLFPVGEIAWRMNLVSAMCASLVLPIFYNLSRRTYEYRLPAITSTLMLATLPTYWRWATVSKHYTLNMFIFVIILWLGTAKPTRYYLHGAMLLVGLQLGVHNTTLLLIPGMALLFLFNNNSGGVRKSHLLTLTLCLTIPLLSYLYIPLRGEWLITQHGYDMAIGHGLLTDFYSSGLHGLIRYFTAADFMQGLTTNWRHVPYNFINVYLLDLLEQDFTRWGVIWGIIGGLIFAMWKPKQFMPFFLIYAIPIPFVLTYNRGEQLAFLLTSNLAFCMFIGASIAPISEFLNRRPKKTLHAKIAIPMLTIGLFLLTLILPYQQTIHNIVWLKSKWKMATYNYWTDILSHPFPEEYGASKLALTGIMATWGDLTSMWYMQHVENLQPSLIGIYPPTEEIAHAWFVEHDSLFIAGPTLDNWQTDVETRYHVIPWGRLVRLSPITTEVIMPRFGQPHTAIFGQRLRLENIDFNSHVDSGGTLYVYSSWQSLTDLPELTRYSLRLTKGDTIISQKDDTLLSGWFPLNYIPKNQFLVGAYPLHIAVGTLPGTYQLQLAIYAQEGDEWKLADGKPILNLGQIDVRFSAATTSPSPLRFNGEISLDDVEFSVSRARQGKGFAVRLLWQALKPLQDNYTLHVELVDENGHVWRDWYEPTETSTWQANQHVRQHINIIVPAVAPTHDDSLQIQVSWLRPDGSQLDRHYWFIPVGKKIDIGSPIILPKAKRTFIIPAMENNLRINFANQARLIGYSMPHAINSPAEELPLILYWQGLDDMREVYTVFVHVIDEDGNIVAQHDGIHANGKEPTTSWATGEYITDHVTIPLSSDLPKGTYHVMVGMYLPQDGYRLSQFDEEGNEVGDSVEIGIITVN